MGASDTGCTSPLVTETLLASGKLLNLKTETKSTVQVAGGKRILGTNYTCLLPIKQTNSNNTHIETVATSVPQIIENIPTIEITELTKNEENNTQPRCKLEQVQTKYGRKISKLLSQETFRPRIFSSCKGHHRRTD